MYEYEELSWFRSRWTQNKEKTLSEALGIEKLQITEYTNTGIKIGNCYRKNEEFPRWLVQVN